MAQHWSCKACCSAALYALFAAGLSLIFGIMRLVNLAHGDIIVLAAYVALVTADQAIGLSLAPSPC